jgi:hypothetical protein
MADSRLLFIDEDPWGKADPIRARKLRREIKSHAARVAAYESVARPRRRRRRKPYLSWSCHISIPDPPREQSGETTPIPQGSMQSIHPSSSPFGSNCIPASESPIFYHPTISAVLHNCKSRLILHSPFQLPLVHLWLSSTNTDDALDLKHLAVAIPELDDNSEMPLLQTRWFPMVLHSPIIFQVIVLFSAAHYASHQHTIALEETILSFKQCALSSLAKALSSTSKVMVCRDEVIAAVVKMASYEAIYGEESAYHSHMNAVDEMLRLRGGLTALGLGGFLSRLLIFVDTNSAFLRNTHLHLRDSSFPKPANPFIVPNLSQFIGEV